MRAAELLSDAANSIDDVDGPTNGIALCQGGSGYSHPRGAIHGTAYHDRPRSGQEWQKMLIGPSTKMLVERSHILGNATAVIVGISFELEVLEHDPEGPCV